MNPSSSATHLAEKAYENGLVSTGQLERVRTGSPNLGELARVLLTIPFDYTTLTHRFANLVVEEQATRPAYRQAFEEEIANPRDRYLQTGYGATCLTASMESARMFSEFGYAARVIGTRTTTSGRAHFATLIVDKGIEYYFDHSIGTVEPIPLSRSAHFEKGPLPIATRLEDSVFEVSVGRDTSRRSLWEFDRMIDQSNHDLIDMMIESWEPSHRDDPRQYLSIGAIRSGRKFTNMLHSHDLLRIRCSSTPLDEIEIKIGNDTQQRRMTYPASQLREASAYVERFTGVEIPDDFFTMVADANRIIHTRRRKR